MRTPTIAALLFCLALAACDKSREEAKGPTTAHGRYLGVGTYPAGRLWPQLAGAPEPKDKAKARLADDEHVIVVVDSRTGEVRQCGDMSGYCVAMNPWRAPAQAAPAALAKHGAEVDAEAAADKPPPMENEATRARPATSHAR